MVQSSRSLIAPMPRSRSRDTAPVRRSRWKRRLSACRCSNTRSATWREVRAITRANTTPRSSWNRVPDRRSRPYAPSSASGSSSGRWATLSESTRRAMTSDTPITASLATTRKAKAMPTRAR